MKIILKTLKKPKILEIKNNIRRPQIKKFWNSKIKQILQNTQQKIKMSWTGKCILSPDCLELYNVTYIWWPWCIHTWRKYYRCETSISYCYYELNTFQMFVFWSEISLSIFVLEWPYSGTWGLYLVLKFSEILLLMFLFLFYV